MRFIYHLSKKNLSLSESIPIIAFYAKDSANFLYFCVLYRCSTGADPVTDPVTLGSVAKVVGSWEKASKNGGSVRKSPTG